MDHHTRLIPIYIRLLDDIVDQVGQSSVGSCLMFQRRSAKTVFVCPVGQLSFVNCHLV